MGLGFVEFIERFMEAAASRLRTTYAWSLVLATAARASDALAAVVVYRWLIGAATRDWVGRGEEKGSKRYGGNLE
jgi:hypothetical protein